MPFDATQTDRATPVRCAQHSLPYSVGQKTQVPRNHIPDTCVSGDRDDQRRSDSKVGRGFAPGDQCGETMLVSRRLGLNVDRAQIVRKLLPGAADRVDRAIRFVLPLLI